MPADTSASINHEAILCYEADKRVKVTTNNGKFYGTIMGIHVGISEKAAYAIITDTKDILILNSKQLEAGIKACGLGSRVVIELSDDNDNDNDNDNSIAIKKNNVTYITTPTTTNIPFTAPMGSPSNVPFKASTY